MLKTNINRRKLLIGSAGALSAAAVPRIVRGQSLSKYSDDRKHLTELLASDQVSALASRSVEIAQAGGALYSDVRIVRRVVQSVSSDGQVNGQVWDEENLGINVRVLIDGYWGFAASPYWDEDEAVLLAEEAVRQARANASRGPKDIVWNKLPPQKGEWLCPGIDPLSITLEEKIDFINSWRMDVTEYRDGIHQVNLDQTRVGCHRYEWWFCSSEGAELHQVFFNTYGSFSLKAGSPAKGSGLPASLEQTRSQMGGWEVLLNARVNDRIPELIDKSMETAGLGFIPVDIGRSNLLIDASTAASLLGSTFAGTTQLDQMLGYEANAGGVSYLGPDPYEFLGNPVAAPSITISANRNNPSEVATRKWDDEGIVPQSFDIVKEGVLVDCQTNRELSSELSDWYSSQGMNPGSRGCASSGSGLDTPMIFAPNLELAPAKNTASFDDLIATTGKGYALFRYSMRTSFQGKDGLGVGGGPLSYAREVVNGKLGNRVGGLGILFRTDEIWKNITASGDDSTVKYASHRQGKGQPYQTFTYSIKAVPLSIKDVAIIDPSRRA